MQVTPETVSRIRCKLKKDVYKRQPHSTRSGFRTERGIRLQGSGNRLNQVLYVSRCKTEPSKGEMCIRDRGIDEVCLSRGELYTILINKEKTGRSGSMIAIVKGTDVRSVTSVLLRLSRRRRFQVREITMDMACL